jgi:hypothetical protein
MHGSRSKIPSKKSRPYIYIYIHDVKFLTLLGAPYIYDICRLRVNEDQSLFPAIKRRRSGRRHLTFILCQGHNLNSHVWKLWCIIMHWENFGDRDRDSLRVGRSGDRIPVWARFSTLVQTSLGDPFDTL